MELKFILEAILFASQKPVTTRELRDLLKATAEQSEDETIKSYKKLKEDEITEALNQLEKEHAEAGRSFLLACIAGSWQFVSKPEFSPWLKTMIGEKNRPPRLSQPALETLTIIAYRQPLTRAEIEQIRGVAVDGVMQTLLERGLVEQAGRAEVIGRPMTYATTALFLEYFGLRRLEDLPAADELRKIPVTKPEALLTTENGATEAAPALAADASGAPNDQTQEAPPASAENNSPAAEMAGEPVTSQESTPEEAAPANDETVEKTS